MLDRTPWEVYLANLERYLATHSLRQIRLISHSHQNRVSFWRKTIPEFRAKEAELLETRKKLDKTHTLAERQAEVRFPRRFRLFMDFLRKLDNRLEACAQTGVTWAEVKHGLEDHEGFRMDYLEWVEEQNIRLEDAQAKKGLNGDSSAARAVLQARDPRYRNRGVTANGSTDDSSQEADRFLERMEARAPAPIIQERPDVDEDDEAQADA